jgi:hypothetical protein
LSIPQNAGLRVRHRGLGSLLVIILLTQKLVAILKLLVQARQGTLLTRSLALTRLNQRPFGQTGTGQFDAVNVGEAPAKRLH